MSDLMELKDQIKNTVEMRDVIDRLSLGPIKSGKIRSIYKTEKTPSLHVYKYDYFDYATGQGGDVIRFTMDAMSWSFVNAIRWLSRGGDELAPRRKVPEKKIQDFTRLFNSISPSGSMLPWTLAEQYVKSKWPTLSIHDIVAYGSKLKSDNTIWTPHWHAARVEGIKIRSIDGGGKRSVTGSTFRSSLYHVAQPLFGGKRAWIVEGESDCWALTKHLDSRYAKIDVYALPSGAGLWRDEWRKQLAGYGHVIVCTDNDEAGKAARDRIMGSLVSGGMSTGTFTVETDVAAALATGWEPYLGENSGESK